MSGASRDEPLAPGPRERRVGQRRVNERRRTYNRRSDESEMSPPYFEVFERIASALERVETLLHTGKITLPDVEASRKSNR